MPLLQLPTTPLIPASISSSQLQSTICIWPHPHQNRPFAFFTCSYNASCPIFISIQSKIRMRIDIWCDCSLISSRWTFYMLGNGATPCVLTRILCRSFHCAFPSCIMSRIIFYTCCTYEMIVSYLSDHHNFTLDTISSQDCSMSDAKVTRDDIFS